MTEQAPGSNRVAGELYRLRMITSDDGLMVMKKNLETYLTGRQNPGEAKNIPHYAETDKIYKGFTDEEISQIIQGLR